jgi:hypothetical protein
MRRITVAIEPAERNALIALAIVERRDPRQQAALIIRRELERLGYITPENKHAHPTPTETEATPA